MFLVSSASKFKSFTEDADEGPNWPLRGLVATTIVTIAGAAMAIDYTQQPKASSFSRPPTKGEVAMLDILKFFECFYFGLALAFTIFCGVLCLKVAPQFRRKVLCIYLSIVWIMVSWFPHTLMHSFFPTIWGLISLDICFHMTTAFAACLLSFYAVKLMQRASKTKFRRIKKWTPRHIARADTAQVVFLIFVIGGLAFGLSFLIPLTGPPPTTGQLVLLRLLMFAECSIFGSACAFVIKMIPLIRRMEGRSIKVKSSILVFSIAWLLGNWWPHVRLHYQTDDMGHFSPKQFILIDTTFHWTIMICSAFLSYTVFGIVKLVINFSKSPFRRMESSSGGIDVTSVQSGDTIDMSVIDVDMDSA